MVLNCFKSHKTLVCKKLRSKHFFYFNIFLQQIKNWVWLISRHCQKLPNLTFFNLQFFQIIFLISALIHSDYICGYPRKNNVVDLS